CRPGHPGLGRGSGRSAGRFARPARHPRRAGLRRGAGAGRREPDDRARARAGRRDAGLRRGHPRRLLSAARLTPAGLLPTAGTPRMSDSPFGQVKKAKPEIDFPGDTPPTELVVEDIEVGKGAEATAGSQISAHYVGVAWSTGEEFDASWNRGQPLDFT